VARDVLKKLATGTCMVSEKDPLCFLAWLVYMAANCFHVQLRLSNHKQFCMEPMFVCQSANMLLNADALTPHR
jgi:hypothetical protein